METTFNFTRRRSRLPLKLPIQVACRETAEYHWTESSRLIDVNHFGAGFTVNRPIDVGRLVQLEVPLPYQLRCFDYSEPMYTVWGLVRHAAAIAKVHPDEPAQFRVGVGFIGKHPPLSYEQDPTIRYEPLLVNIGSTSLWRLVRRQFEKQRREPRLVIPLEILVETLDGNGQPGEREFTVTETISSLGTCIPTSLDVEVGRVVKLSSTTDGVSIFAAIRSREVAADGIPRVGLEFLGNRWPLNREVQPVLKAHPPKLQRRMKPSRNGSFESK